MSILATLLVWNIAVKSHSFNAYFFFLLLEYTIAWLVLWIVRDCTTFNSLILSRDGCTSNIWGVEVCSLSSSSTSGPPPITSHSPNKQFQGRVHILRGVLIFFRHHNAVETILVKLWYYGCVQSSSYFAIITVTSSKDCY